MKKLILYLILVLASILIGGFYSIKMGVQSFPHVDANQIEEWPLHAQPDNIACGPTCVKMVLEKYGIIVPLEKLKVQSFNTWYKKKLDTEVIEVGGTVPDALVKTLKKNGLKSRYKKASLDELKFCVDNKRPPIVLVRSGKRMWHFVVFIGYDKNRVLIANPSGGEKEWLDNETFLGVWNFKTSLRDKEITQECPVCQGNGEIGLLGQCDFCMGTGKTVDHWLELYLLAGYPPRTAIIPESAF